MLREYVTALGLFNKRWFLIALPPLIVGVIQVAALLLLEPPSDLHIARPWIASPWLWMAAILCGLCIVQFLAWTEEHALRKQAQTNAEHIRVDLERVHSMDITSRQRDWNLERDGLKNQISDMGRPLVSMALEDGNFVLHNHESVAFRIQVNPIFLAESKRLTFPIIHSLAAGAKTRVGINEIGLSNDDPSDEHLLRLLLEDLPAEDESVSEWAFTIDYMAKNGQEWMSHEKLVYDRAARVMRLEHVGAVPKPPPAPQSSQYYLPC